MKKAISILLPLLALSMVIAVPAEVLAQTTLEVNGPPVQLTTDGGHYLGSFSPDGSRIVFAGSNGGIYIMNADGSGVTKVGNITGSRPKWTPDGRISYASGNDLDICNTDGTGEQTVVTVSNWSRGNGQVTSGVHSHDWIDVGGTYKLAIATSTGVSTIYVADVNFSALPLQESDFTRITDGATTAYAPAWSPDGTEIACAYGPSTNLYVGVFKSDGSQTTPVREIGIGGSYGGDYPDWGTNNMIAYNDGSGQLHVMNSDGSNDKVVFAGPAKMVAWSPDCKRLVYLDSFGGNVMARGYPYTNIQDAIDAASNGDTIDVAAGTYAENLLVTKDNITLLGDPGATGKAGPGSSAPAIAGQDIGSGVYGAVTIEAAGVTISGFDISSPYGFYGVAVGDPTAAGTGGAPDNDVVSYNRLHDVNGTSSGDGIRVITVQPSSNVDIKYNIVENSTPTNAAANSYTNTIAGIFIHSQAGAFSNTTIEDNIVRNITQNNATGNRSTIGIWVGGSAGTATVSNLKVVGNQISGIESNLSARGFMINHGYNSTGTTTGLDIEDNTISNVTGTTMVRGIALETTTPGATISNNTISSLVDSDSPTNPDVTGIAFVANPTAWSVTLSNNTFDGHSMSSSKSGIVVNGSWSSLSTSSNTYPEVLFNGSYYYYGINAYSTIQSGVDSASAGATVTVASGTYAGRDITISRSMTLTGASGAKVVVPDSTAAVNGFDVKANNVTIQGLEIAGPVTSSYTTYAWGSHISRGIAVPINVTGFSITNNNIHDVRNGILVNGINSTGSITKNRIENTKSAISVQYTDGSGITMSGNTQGPYGNEWGLNLHLNGYWDGTTYQSNPYPGGAAPAAVQSALLANSSANSDWTVQDQSYTSCNRTQVQVATTGSSGAQGSVLTPINTIQAGVDAVVSGGTVNVAAGTYTLSGRLTINKSLTLSGADESNTTIDASANGADYGILMSASDIKFSNFTITPPSVSGKSGTSGGGGYAIHVSNTPQIVSNITITHVTVKDGNRTGVDLNSVDNAVVSYVTSQNAAYGNGISLTGVHGANLSHITTGGNAWGGIAIYCSSQTTRGSDSINVDGPTCTITEPNKIYSQNQFGLTNTNTTLNGYDFLVRNTADTESTQYTWYQDNLTDAVTLATTLMNTVWANSDTASYISQISTGSYYVGTGMRIQTGIDAASAGDTVHVLAGTFDGTFNINKRISLIGAGSDDAGTVIDNSAAQGDFTKLPEVAGVTYGGYRPNVIISASGTDSDNPILIKDLQINPGPNIGYPRPGILLQPGTSASGYVASYSYLKLDNVRIIGNVSGDTPGQASPHVAPSSSNEWGVTIDGATSLSNFVVDSCEFSDMTYGMVFFNNASNPSTVQYMQMSNTTFDSNSVKGFYTEKLSDATLTDVTVAYNGNIARSPYYWAWDNAGVDINLKYGSYKNLVFNNLTVTGNGIGSYDGAGLTVKARGTGTDATSPSATLDGVTVNGGTFTGNTTGIEFGAVANPPAPDYWSPPAQSLLNTSPTNIDVNDAAIYGNKASGISNLLSGVAVNAVGNWYGAASGPYEASTNSSASGDTISDNVYYSPWWTMNYVGNSHSSPWTWEANSDVDDAVDALGNGDTLDVTAGTCTGNVNISKNVVLEFATPPTVDSLAVNSDSLDLSSDLTINSCLDLTGGNIVTHGDNEIVFGTSAKNPVETSNGKIIGTVKVDPRDVGTDSLCLLGLDIRAGTDNLGNVSFTRKSGSLGIVTAGGKSGIATTWQISVDHQPTTGRTVTFSWLRAFDDGVDTNNVVMYRDEGSGWQAYAGPFSVSGNPRQITLTVYGFSSWTVASGSDHSLPVEATSFLATPGNNKVTLTWKTQSEVNNAGFNVLREDPGESSFELIAGYKTDNSLKGLGTNSSGRDYSFTDTKVKPGSTYQYKIEGVSDDGMITDFSTLSVTLDVPTEYALYQNYPNPFNPSTTIRFDLKQTSTVEIAIYNALGQRVKELNYGTMNAGRYNEVVNMNRFASGVYFYRIQATGPDGESFVSTRKLLLMK